MAPVLLVDDVGVLREMMADALRIQGIEVVEAADGQEAMERMGILVPSLVVLDLDMPRADGRAVHAWMLSTGREGIPVLIVSANLARAPAALPTIAKPFELEVLLQAVATHRRN